MSLLFAHYDRTHLCDHTGMLGRPASDGSRICVRCGQTVPAEVETFTEPTGSPARRRTERRPPGR